MKVTILFANGKIESYDGIRLVCNASTTHPVDWVDIYRFNDVTGWPSIKYPITDIKCIAVEVSQ